MNKIIIIFLFCLVPSFVFSGELNDSSTLTITGMNQVVAKSGSGSFALGTILPWFTNKPIPIEPEKWLECNGSTIPNLPEYNPLKGLLGKNTVPDYQNIFLEVWEVEVMQLELFKVLQ